jgi:hypothetical protein
MSNASFLVFIEFISGGISPVAPPVETGGAIIINNHKKKCFLRMDSESVE